MATIVGSDVVGDTVGDPDEAMVGDPDGAMVGDTVGTTGISGHTSLGGGEREV
jgi:hypothetical protein